MPVRSRSIIRKGMTLLCRHAYSPPTPMLLYERADAIPRACVRRSLSTWAHTNLKQGCRQGDGRRHRRTLKQ
eukprot:26015-Eustigmatos_ZCMA.PRE.1